MRKLTAGLFEGEREEHCSIGCVNQLLWSFALSRLRPSASSASSESRAAHSRAAHPCAVARAVASSMFSLLEALKETCFKQPELNICIVGVDGSGKTSVLERAKGAFGSRLPPLPLSKITPTTGMNLAQMELARSKVTFWDLGGGAATRSLWARYYAETHGVVFVVDAADADRLREARDAFRGALDHPDLADAPFLVLANKQDAVGACGADELATLFEVRELQRAGRRSVDLRACSCADAANVEESLLWLVHEAKALAPRAAPNE